MFSEISPQYMNDIYKTVNLNNTFTRNYFLKLFQPLRTRALSQKYLSYLGPFIWKGLPDDVYLSNSVNMFKYEVKKEILDITARKRSW